MAMRQQFVGGHGARLSALAAAMGERQAVTMRYQSTGMASGHGVTDASDVGAAAQQLSEMLAAALQQQRLQELKRGVTLVGPHRDELQLLLGARELRTFGSAGQQRSAAIALRLLELDTVRAAIGRAPLLLLDDPFAELDLGRAARVLALLEEAGVGQVLLAVPRTEDIPAVFTRLERRTMCDGVLS
jgi:DNA replication and repair protein RecF